VHYFTKIGSGEFEDEFEDSSECGETDELLVHDKNKEDESEWKTTGVKKTSGRAHDVVIIL